MFEVFYWISWVYLVISFLAGGWLLDHARKEVHHMNFVEWVLLILLAIGWPLWLPEYVVRRYMQ